MMYLEREQTQVLLRAGGSSYAVTQLQKASVVPDPPQKIKDCIHYLLEYGTLKCAPYLPDALGLDVAIKWNNPALWIKAANECGFQSNPFKFGWKKVVAAWDKFGFEALRPS